MDSMDMLDGLMKKKTDSYLEFSNKYSWFVYSAVREKCPDQTEADKLYAEIMNGFYRCLYENKNGDAVEALLSVYMEKVLAARETVFKHTDLTPECQTKMEHEDSPDRKVEKGGFLYHLGMVLLIILNLATLWVIAGLLMEINVIPSLDLGYAWFNANIAQWF